MYKRASSSLIFGQHGVDREELDQEMGDQVQIIKLDVDENPEVAGAFQIQSIPTLMMFKDGQPVSKTMGFQPKEALKEFIATAQ